LIDIASTNLTTRRALSIALGALLLLVQDLCGAPSQLAVELFEEGDWTACRTECRRAAAQDPTAEILLLEAVCERRLGRDARPALREICSNPAATKPTAAMAHYELGRAEWIAGDLDAAFANLHSAFLMASAVDLHRRAGCTLSLVIKEEPELARGVPGLEVILATSRKQWTRALRAECQKPKAAGKRLVTAPARWLITFYQTQVGPAIGDRCSLHPSCSRYAKQALQTHGIVGVAAMGDRFIREASVVSAREHPVMIHGQRKYHDPLSDHDGWIGQ